MTASPFTLVLLTAALGAALLGSVAAFIICLVVATGFELIVAGGREFEDG